MNVPSEDFGGPVATVAPEPEADGTSEREPALASPLIGSPPQRRSRRAVVGSAAAAAVLLGATILALMPRSDGTGDAPLVRSPASQPAIGSTTPSTGPALSSIPAPPFSPFSVPTHPNTTTIHVPSTKAHAASPAPKPTRPALVCSASVSNPRPTDRSTTNVIVQTRPDTEVHATANFQSGPVDHSATAGTDGVATIPFVVPSNAAAGFTVMVNIVVAANGQQGNCSTAFITAS